MSHKIRTIWWKQWQCPKEYFFKLFKPALIHLFSASEASSSVSGVSSASSTIKKVEVAKKDLATAATIGAAATTGKDTEAAKVGQNGEEEVANQGGAEGEDTMKNLRKTFAGIFGDTKLQ